MCFESDGLFVGDEVQVIDLLSDRLEQFQGCRATCDSNGALGLDAGTSCSFLP